MENSTEGRRGNLRLLAQQAAMSHRDFNTLGKNVPVSYKSGTLKTAPGKIKWYPERLETKGNLRVKMSYDTTSKLFCAREEVLKLIVTESPNIFPRCLLNISASSLSFVFVLCYKRMYFILLKKKPHPHVTVLSNLF